MKNSVERMRSVSWLVGYLVNWFRKEKKEYKRQDSIEYRELASLPVKIQVTRWNN